MARSRVLIIDDDESIRKVLGFILEDAGYEVLRAADANEGIALVREQRPDVVLSDIKMPGRDGIELLGEIKALDRSLPVIILTAFATVETAVEAMKRGAEDYLTKPISRDELRLTVEKALRVRKLEAENASLRESLDDLRGRFRFDSIIGVSEAMRSVFDTMAKIAASDATVLVTGESGTGKELVARAIHVNSPRRDHRLVAVNCAAIPGELLESELFGHVRGAFTGAVRDKTGKFEQADGGTILLDEVGSMPITLQAKLLRVLQEREVERIGGEKPIEVDVRVIAASNRPLAAMVSRGEFRDDLYYRLNVVPINLPPLRERSGDIPLLARHFAQKYGGGDVRFTDAALRAMESYRWPGNVRELENFCERIILMRPADTIDVAPVREMLESLAGESPGGTSSSAPTLPEMERQAIVDALQAAGGNQSRAARILGIPRHVLLYRLKKFNITPRG